MHARSNGRLNKTHLASALPVAPVTRAIRAALAISATLLALGGSASAVAQGTCSFTAPTTVSCEGGFTNTLPDPTLFTPVNDLTLVMGDSANSIPTAVMPGAGSMGINANWGGSVGVTSYADITTVGATGIFANSLSTSTVSNQGSVSTKVTASNVRAMDVNAYGDVSVVNNGPINAYSTGVYDVTAVNAYSTNGNVTVDNQVAGSITATAQDGNAIAISAYAGTGAVTVSNEGAITASTANGSAVGVFATTGAGDVGVTNSGSISATSNSYQALGILASSGTASASVTNAGSVAVTGGQDDTIGISASGYLSSTVENTGQVSASSTGYGEAIGVLAQAYNGGASVTNSGSITSATNSQYQAAIGISASSNNGPTSINNSGYVGAVNKSGLAIGLDAYSEHDNSSIINSGYVNASSTTGSATGLLANSVYGDVSVGNNVGANIRVVVTNGISAAYGAPSAGIGIEAQSTHGNVSVTNAGSIYGASLHGAGIGISASAGGSIYVNNAATGSVHGLGLIYGNATGINANSISGTATVVNSGRIYAQSANQLGTYHDINRVSGIEAQGIVGVTVSNTGSGLISALGAWYGTGIYTESQGGTTISNSTSGRIAVTGLVAKGIYAIETVQTYSQLGSGDITVENAGRIAVTQTGSTTSAGPRLIPYGTGISALSSFGGDISVTNSGSVLVDTTQGGYGIKAYGFVGKVSENNSGNIAISGSGTHSPLIGEYGKTAYSAGGVDIVNSGDITITSAPVIAGYNVYAGTNVGVGIRGLAGREGSVYYHGGGDVIVLNSGKIAINSNFSYGLQANSQYGTARATNAGDISLNGFNSVGIAVGAGNIVAANTGLGASAVNTGTISATGTNFATGIRAETYGSAGAAIPFQIINSGGVIATAQVSAQGLTATTFNTDPVTINNSGSVYANAPVNALQSYSKGSRGDTAGIHLSAYAGTGTVTNSGSITAITHENNQAPGSASGVFMANGYSSAFQTIFGNAVLANTGSINASLISSNASPAVGNQGASGSNTASGILSTNTYGDLAITNAGMVNAAAQSDHYSGAGVDIGVTSANGISAVSFMGGIVNTNTLTAGDISLVNSSTGTISATSQSSDAPGDTATANGITANVTVGSYGASLVSAGHGITITNAGLISATALIANDPTGSANATGISAINGSSAGFASVTNSGAITATATTTGAATASGILASGYSASAALNAGSVINATATGATGASTGLSLTNLGTGAVTTNNDGMLMATFTGTGVATGAVVTSAGNVTFNNTGHILASNATSAVGVDLVSPSAVTLNNSGTITANSSGVGSVAVLTTGVGNDTLSNTGTINGAIQTGAGSDIFTNAVGGVWNAAGSSSFGEGDDTINNAGTVFLNHSTIDLGASGPVGNAFSNTGTINVSGASQISVGTGNTFTNTGTINFQNGVVGDTLAIAGNFAGSGSISLDVSGLHGTADQLAISGNVAASSVTKVNIDVLDDPTQTTTIIPLVNVGGTAAAGNFELGTIVQNKSFLQLSDVLVTNANAGVFSLGLTNNPPPAPPAPLGTPSSPPAPPAPGSGIGVGVGVSGLSNLGTLAVSAAPGAQSLMNSQIGTLEERMGATSQTLKGGLSLWLRVFGDSGKVDPTHSASNFGQAGNFAFDQNNEGQELGLDFALTDELKAGLLLAKGEANQHLVDGNNGSSNIRATTSGIYATWTASTGFYVDASYRSMTFNSHLRTAAGQAWLNGKSDAFNVETGRTFTLGNGLQIAPQFQYTWDRVDDVKSETASLAGFDSRGDNSSRARLGLMVSKSYNAADQKTVWTPYASLSAVHEFDGKNRYSIDNTFDGQTSIQGTSALIEGGVNVKFHNVALYGGVNWLDGGAQKSFFGGQVGVRYTW